MVSKHSSSFVKFLRWMRLAVPAELLRSDTGTHTSEAESDVLIGIYSAGSSEVWFNCCD